MSRPPFRAERAVRHVDPLLTGQDLVGILHVNRHTVWRMCQTGRLPKPLKIGRHNRWIAADVDVEQAIAALGDRQVEHGVVNEGVRNSTDAGRVNQRRS